MRDFQRHLYSSKEPPNKDIEDEVVHTSRPQKNMIFARKDPSVKQLNIFNSPGGIISVYNDSKLSRQSKSMGRIKTA